MTELTNARPIKAISFGGPIENGHGVAFRIVFQDETYENYYCRADQLPVMMGSLHAFGDLAEKMRGGVKAGEKTIATPYQVTEVANSGRSDDGQIIAVRFSTVQGFPLEISMTPAQARKTIEFLQREIDGGARKGPSPGLN